MRWLAALALLGLFAAPHAPAAFTASELWRPLGTSAAVAAVGSLAGVAVDSEGNPILTIAESPRASAGGGYRVLHWDGSRWRDEGLGSATPSPRTLQSSTLTDAADRLWMAWVGSISGTFSQVTAAVRTDGVWHSAGRHSSFAGGISRTSGWSWDPVMAIGADGNPLIAWRDQSTGQSQIYIRRFDGTEWREMGHHSAQLEGVSAFQGEEMGPPALAVGSDGAAHLAWAEVFPLNGHSYWRVTARRWDGTAWQVEGPDVALAQTSVLIAGETRTAMTVLDDNSPVLAWRQDHDSGYTLTARHFDGVAWQPMGGSFPGESNYPRALRGDGVHPIVVATAHPHAFPNGAGICASRWDGTSWAEIGVGSATGGGLSTGLAGTTLPPHAACDASGRPVVAWQTPGGDICLLSAGPGLPHIGDVNGDWEISIADFVKVSDHLDGSAAILDAQAFDRADLTRDGEVTSSDLDALLALLLGL